MKIDKEAQKKRISISILFSAIVLLFLTINAVVTGAVVFYLVYRGSLKFGDIPLNFSSLIFNLLFWSIVNGTILSVIANRIPLKPVDKTLEALDRLSSGDYSARLHFQGPFSRLPVVVELTENFNKMASELQQTALLRSDFINNFSHEFKTPIVSITGFARLLKRGNLTEEKRQEYLNIIEAESMRLSQLATNVLNLTRVENQNILTDVRLFNLTEQIRTSALVLEGKWTKKHIELLLPADEVYATGDEELLKHVWVNLLDNAIKFSPDYGTVEVRIKSESDLISTTISNFGDPIPEKSIDKIFNKFYQADESHSAEGSGIGLAVSKRIVDLHDGKISVDCKNGKTSFTVTIPVAERIWIERPEE